jgi:uncharacterized membrane protein YhaH (DUF805 family)
MADCYYLDGARNQQGPVPSEEIARLIRGGTIRRDTMIWHAGMPDWSPVGQVSEFAALFGQAAPPARPPGPSAGIYQGQASVAHAAYYYPARSMSFGEAIAICFRKFADFDGRARRPEFWWFYLFYYLVNIGLSIIDLTIAASGGPRILALLAWLASWLPWLAVGARRLHDTDRSGWFQLLLLIPLVGFIILVVLWCQRGTDGPNRFGSDDLAVAAEFD